LRPSPAPTCQLQRGSKRDRQDRDTQKGASLAFHSFLIGESVQRGETETIVIPALEPLPSRRPQLAQRRIVGGRQQHKQDQGGDEAGVIGDAEQVMAEGKLCFSFAALS
jgi:hypothetical protein